MKKAMEAVQEAIDQLEICSKH